MRHLRCRPIRSRPGPAPTDDTLSCARSGAWTAGRHGSNLQLQPLCCHCDVPPLFWAVLFWSAFVRSRERFPHTPQAGLRRPLQVSRGPPDGSRHQNLAPVSQFHLYPTCRSTGIRRAIRQANRLAFQCAARMGAGARPLGDLLAQSRIPAAHSLTSCAIAAPPSRGGRLPCTAPAQGTGDREDRIRALSQPDLPQGSDLRPAPGSQTGVKTIMLGSLRRQMYVGQLTSRRPASPGSVYGNDELRPGRRVRLW